MAYDVELADRIRAVVQADPGLAERRMFGGLAFLIQGNVAVSASSQGGLLLRVDPAEAESLISEPHVRRFEMRGRKMEAGFGWTPRWSRATTTCEAGCGTVSRTCVRCGPNGRLPARVTLEALARPSWEAWRGFSSQSIRGRNGRTKLGDVTGDRRGK
jgi:hypothetical protein